MSAKPELDAVAGIHAVLASLKDEPQLITALLVSNQRDDKRLRELITLAEQLGLTIRQLESRELSRRYPSLKHQGVVALCKRPKPVTEKQLFEQLAALPHAGFVVVLDGVTDPHNLGAILRTGSAAGIDCVVAPRAGSVGLTPAARRVASGAASSVPFCQVGNLVRTLQALQSAGYWVYGAADSAHKTYTEIDYRSPVCLVLGAEGTGLRRLTMEGCDELIGIPMAGRVSSLNVSVAAGILMFEGVRQRGLALSV